MWDDFFSPWIPTCSYTWVSFLEAVHSLRLLRSRSRYWLKGRSARGSSHQAGSQESRVLFQASQLIGYLTISGAHSPLGSLSPSLGLEIFSPEAVFPRAVPFFPLPSLRKRPFKAVGRSRLVPTVRAAAVVWLLGRLEAFEQTNSIPWGPWEAGASGSQTSGLKDRPGGVEPRMQVRVLGFM